jgi:hypothetical protein
LVSGDPDWSVVRIAERGGPDHGARPHNPTPSVCSILRDIKSLAKPGYGLILREWVAIIIRMIRDGLYIDPTGADALTLQEIFRFSGNPDLWEELEQWMGKRISQPSSPPQIPLVKKQRRLRKVNCQQQ